MGLKYELNVEEKNRIKPRKTWMKSGKTRKILACLLKLHGKIRKKLGKFHKNSI